MRPRLKLEVCAFFVDEFLAALAAEKRDDIELVPIQGACDERRRPVPTGAPPAPSETPALRLMGVCSGRAACPKTPHSCFEFLLGPDKVDALLSEGAHLLTPAMVRAYPETLQSLNENPESLRTTFAESVRAWVVVDIGVTPLTAAEQAAFVAGTGGKMELLPTEPHLFRANLRAALAQWEAAAIATRSNGQIASLQHCLADYTMAYDLISRLIPYQGEQTIVHGILELFYMLCAPRAVHLLLVQGGGKDGDANIVEESAQLFSSPAGSGREDHIRPLLRCPAPWGEIEAPQGFYFQIHQGEQTLGTVVVEGAFLPERQRNYLELALLLMPILRLALHNARSYERLCNTECELRASQMELEQRVEKRTRELRESEERLKEAQRIAKVGSWRLDVATNHVVWSEELYRMLGLNPDLPPPDYTEHHQLFTPGSWDRLSATLTRTLETGVPYELELEMIRADGRHGWMLARGEVLRDASGSIATLQGVAVDITERKLSEEALRKSKKQLQFVSNHAPVSIAQCNSERRYRFVNQSYAMMFGLQPADIIGKHLRDVLGEETYVHASPYIDAVLAGQLVEYDITLRATPGGSREIHARYAPERDASGRVVGFIAAILDVTERKRSEDELRIAAAAFETQDAIMITDADGNIIRVNQAFSTITGYSQEEALGKNMGMMNSGQGDHDSCIEMLQQSIHDGSWAGEIYDKRKNGQTYPKWMTVTAIKNERQEITHYVSIFSDITARKQVGEARLLESEERFRGTLEQVAVGIVHTSLDGSFQRINVRFCEIVGYSYDELIQMSFQEITFPADLEENLHYLQQLLADEISTYAMEKRYVRKDQSLVWVNLTVSMLRDADGTPKYTIGVIEDITERKQAEVLVEQFGSLLQGSFNEIYLFDAHSLRFLLTSEGAEKNLGYSAEEMNQLTPLDIRPLFTRESFEQMIAPLRSGEQQSLFFETVQRRKDGTTYPVEVRLQLMQGERPVFLAIVQDIAERKQAELDLLESHTQLRGLSAHLQFVREEERILIAREVHDELGQILTALRMKISMLRMQPGANNPVLTEQVPGMVQLVDRAIQGVRDVATSLRPAALDMGIVPALEWLSNDFATHSGIPCVLHGAGIEIELDESRAVAVFRIVQEALTNVARHAEAGRVEIVLEQMNGGIKMVVRDDGRGFDPSALAHKKTFGLLGMRERAFALGGEVGINSTPGHGTEISILLPPHPRNREKKQWLLLPPG